MSIRPEGRFYSCSKPPFIEVYIFEYDSIGLTDLKITDIIYIEFLNNMKLHAYPGCYLLEKIKEPTSINLGNAKSKHIIYGRIIDVGKPRTHDSGGKLEPFCKVGQTLFFINYGSDEKYEEFDFEGKTYFSVIFNDSRAYLE